MKQTKPRFFLSATTWSVVFVAALTLGVIGLLIFYWQPLSALFSDKEQLKRTIEAAGVWGPLVFVGIQFLQVIFAPIPGQAIGVLAGALFGPLLGTAYSMLGALLGFTVIFVVVRRLGRPFVERFVDTKHLEKFDYLTKTNGPMVFFLIFLMPIFPDDIICYLAGLSAIPIRSLILVSVLGRLPGYLVLSLFGAGIANTDIWLIVSITTFFVVIGVAAYWQRVRLEAWVKKVGS